MDTHTDTHIHTQRHRHIHKYTDTHVDTCRDIHTHRYTDTHTDLYTHTQRHRHTQTHTDRCTHTNTHRDTVLWVWGGFIRALKGEVRCSEVQVTSQEESREDNMEAVDGQGRLFTKTALTKAGHREGPGLWVGP